MGEKRRPVPTFARCEPTIKREARYWSRQFRGQMTAGDLEGEAWEFTIEKVLPAYDPMRDVTIETYLTGCLRRHFQRMIKQHLTRAFLYTIDQRAVLVNNLRREADDPLALLAARMKLERLATLLPHQAALARLLVKYDGNVTDIARALGWTRHD